MPGMALGSVLVVGEGLIKIKLYSKIIGLNNTSLASFFLWQRPGVTEALFPSWPSASLSLSGGFRGPSSERGLVRADPGDPLLGPVSQLSRLPAT